MCVVLDAARVNIENRLANTAVMAEAPDLCVISNEIMHATSSTLNTFEQFSRGVVFTSVSDDIWSVMWRRDPLFVELRFLYWTGVSEERARSPYWPHCAHTHTCQVPDGFLQAWWI